VDSIGNISVNGKSIVLNDLWMYQP